MKKRAAAAVLGPLPDTTLEESRDYLEKARELNPDWVMNLMWLGKVLL